jgi:hypothetical protein
MIFFILFWKNYEFQSWLSFSPLPEKRCLLILEKITSFNHGSPFHHIRKNVVYLFWKKLRVLIMILLFTTSGKTLFS